MTPRVRVRMRAHLTHRLPSVPRGLHNLHTRPPHARTMMYATAPRSSPRPSRPNPTPRSRRRRRQSDGRGGRLETRLVLRAARLLALDDVHDRDGGADDARLEDDRAVHVQRGGGVGAGAERADASELRFEPGMGSMLWRWRMPSTRAALSRGEWTTAEERLCSTGPFGGCSTVT